MFCNKCGAPLKEGAKFCTRCGSPVAVSAPEQTAAPAAPVAPAWNSYTAAPAAPAPKKGKKGGLAVGLLLAAVAVVAAVLLLTSGSLGMLLSSPEVYYAKEEYSNLAPWIDTVLDSSVDPADMTADVTFALELTEDGKSVLRDFGIEPDEFLANTSITVEAETVIRDDKLRTAMGVALGGEELVSATVLMDMLSGSVYGQIPLFSDTYFVETVDDYTMEQFLIAYESMGDADYTKMAKQLNGLLHTYSKEVLGNLFDFDKSREDLTVGSTSQKCTLYYAEITDLELAHAALAVLERAEKDKDLEKFIRDNIALFEDMGMDADELIDEMHMEIGNAIDVLRQELADDMLGYDYMGDYRVWLDGKGRIVGREFTSWDGSVIGAYNATEGGKQETRIVFDDGYGTFIELTGAGKRSGDVITEGNYLLTVDYNYMVMDVLEIGVDRLDLGKAEKGETDLAVNLRLADDVCDQIYGYGTYAGAVSLDVVAEGDRKDAEVQLLVNYGDKQICSVGLQSAVSGGASVKLPKDAVDTDTWSYELDGEQALEKLMQALRDAGVSETLLEELEWYLY